MASFSGRGSETARRQPTILWGRAAPACWCGFLVVAALAVVQLPAAVHAQPAFSDGYPHVVDVTDSSASVVVALDVPGTIVVVAVEHGDEAPSNSQIIARTDAFDNAPAASGSASTTEAVEEGTVVLEDLAHNTEFDVYLLAAAASSEEDYQEQPSVIRFTTNTDATPPAYILGYPAVTNIRDTTARVSVVLNEAGSFHYVVILPDEEPPSVAGTRLGRSGTGQAALASGTAVVPAASTIGSAEVSGLAANTAYVAYFSSADAASAPNTMEGVVSRQFRTQPDQTPPLMLDGFPTLASVTDSSAIVVGAINEPGTIYVAVTLGGSPTPSAADVISGVGGFVAVQSSAAPIASQGIPVGVSGLHHTTQYDVYFAIADDHISPNVQSETWPVALSTLPDATPPAFLDGSPSVDSITDETCVVSFALNEPGVVFFVILETTRPAPSVAQLKLGYDGADVSAVDRGSKGVSTTGAVVVDTATGMHHSRDYYVYAVAQDEAEIPNEQVVPTVVAFSTGTDVTGPKFVLNYPRIASVTDESVVLEVQYNEAATVFFVMTLEGGAPPPAQDIINDVVSGASFVTSGAFEVTAPASTSELTVTGLTASRDHHFYLVGVDSAGNQAELVTQVDFRTAVDSTAPSFADGFPEVADVGDMSVELLLRIDEPGRVFYVVVLAETRQPSVADVIAGAFIDGNNDVLVRGNRLVVDERVTVQAAIGGLHFETNYSVFLVAQDMEPIPNVQTRATALNFSTFPDTTAPTLLFGYPLAEALSDSTAMVTAKITEPGTIYVVAVPENSGTQPTADEVISGVGPRGVAASAVAVAQVVDASAAVEIMLSGLAPLADYDVYVAVLDSVSPPNVQASVGTITVQTMRDQTPPLVPESWLSSPVADLRDSTVSINFLLNERGYALWTLQNASFPQLDEGSLTRLALDAESIQQRLDAEAEAATEGNNAGQRSLQQGDAFTTLFSGYGAVAAGRKIVPIPFEFERVHLSNLAFDTWYRLTYIVEDDHMPVHNRGAQIYNYSFKTHTDMTPPAFWAGFPLFQDTTHTSTVCVIRLDEPGTVFWVAARQSSSQAMPTAEEVVLGWPDSGFTVIGSGNVTVPVARESVLVDIDGMSAASEYKVYFIAADDVDPPNQQEEAVVGTVLAGDLPLCINGMQDANEGGVDCGGICAETCLDGSACSIDRDCSSSVCFGSVCQVPHCFDNVLNGDELEVDDCAVTQCPPALDAESLGYEVVQRHFDVTDANPAQLEQDAKKLCGLRVAIAAAADVPIDHVRLLLPFESPATEEQFYGDVTTIEFEIIVVPPRTSNDIDSRLTEVMDSGVLDSWIKRNGVGSTAVRDFLQSIAGQETAESFQSDTSSLGSVMGFVLALLALLIVGMCWALCRGKARPPREVEPARRAEFAFADIVRAQHTPTTVVKPSSGSSDSGHSSDETEPYLPSDGSISSQLSVILVESSDDEDISELLRRGENAAQRIINRDVGLRPESSRAHYGGASEQGGDDASDDEMHAEPVDLARIAVSVDTVMADAGLITAEEAERTADRRRRTADEAKRRAHERSTSIKNLAKGLGRLRSGAGGAALGSWAAQSGSVKVKHGD